MSGLAIATVAFQFRYLNTEWAFKPCVVMLWRSLGLGMLFTPLTSAAGCGACRAISAAGRRVSSTSAGGGSIGIAASTAQTVRLKARTRTWRPYGYQPSVQQYLAQTSHWASMHGLSPTVALAMLQNRIVAAATVLAYQDTFVVSALMLAFCIPLAMALRRRPQELIFIGIADDRVAPLEVVREESEAV